MATKPTSSQLLATGAESFCAAVKQKEEEIASLKDKLDRVNKEQAESAKLLVELRRKLEAASFAQFSAAKETQDTMADNSLNNIGRLGSAAGVQKKFMAEAINSLKRMKDGPKMVPEKIWWHPDVHTATKNISLQDFLVVDFMLWKPLQQFNVEVKCWGCSNPSRLTPRCFSEQGPVTVADLNGPALYLSCVYECGNCKAKYSADEQEFLKHLPDWVSCRYPIVKTQQMGITKRLESFMHTLVMTGAVAVGTFEDVMTERYGTEYQARVRNYMHLAYERQHGISTAEITKRLGAKANMQVPPEKLPAFWTPPSDQFFRTQYYDFLTKRCFYFDGYMRSLTGEILRSDGTFKIAQRINVREKAKGKANTPYKCLYQVTNEFGEVCSACLTRSENMTLCGALFEGIADRYKSLGADQPKAWYTDQCCAMRQTIQKYFDETEVLLDALHFNWRWDVDTPKDVECRQFIREAKESLWTLTTGTSLRDAKAWHKRIGNPDPIIDKWEELLKKYEGCRFLSDAQFRNRYDQMKTHVENWCLTDLPDQNMHIQGTDVHGKTHNRTSRGTSQQEGYHRRLQSILPHTAMGADHANLYLKAISFKTNVDCGIKYRRFSDLGTYDPLLVKEMSMLFTFLFPTSNNPYKNWAHYNETRQTTEQFFADYDDMESITKAHGPGGDTVTPNALRNHCDRTYNLQTMAVLPAEDFPWISSVKDSPEIEKQVLDNAKLRRAEIGGMDNTFWTVVNAATGNQAMLEECVDFITLRFALFGFANHESAEEAVKTVHQPSEVAAACFAVSTVSARPILVLRPDCSPFSFAGFSLDQELASLIVLWYASDGWHLLLPMEPGLVISRKPAEQWSAEGENPNDTAPQRTPKQKNAARSKEVNKKANASVGSNQTDDEMHLLQSILLKDGMLMYNAKTKRMRINATKAVDVFNDRSKQKCHSAAVFSCRVRNCKTAKSKMREWWEQMEKEHEKEHQRRERAAKEEKERKREAKKGRKSRKYEEISSDDETSSDESSSDESSASESSSSSESEDEQQKKKSKSKKRSREDEKEKKKKKKPTAAKKSKKEDEKKKKKKPTAAKSKKDSSKKATKKPEGKRRKTITNHRKRVSKPRN